MPFDGTNYPQDVRNLLTLAEALEREHEGFEWDFSEILYETDCGTAGCALGMATRIGLLEDSRDIFPDARRVFGLSAAQITSLFDNLREYGVADYSEVSSQMVAARLREIAAEKMRVA